MIRSPLTALAGEAARASTDVERARWVYHDGGRAAAGFRGEAGDCVVRAVAIAAELPYLEVYESIFDLARPVPVRRRAARDGAGYSRSPRKGVRKNVLRAFIEGTMGWKWTPTMFIGSGCTVHLRREELPPGRLIVRTSKHAVAVIDGVIYDTDDPSRDGTRCVYGYWQRDNVG